MIRRAEDLNRRCQRNSELTHTNFLSPAERAELEAWARHMPDCRVRFFGGNEDCERTLAFFLPDWMEEDSAELSEYLRAMAITAYFGTPAHRDYLGALLGMGIDRQWLGDIRVIGNEASIFCLPSVLRHLLSIEKVGRCGVKTRELALSQVPAPERRVKEKRFSVQSMRLDAVLAGLFDLSRSEAARQIRAGLVTVNYLDCQKCDLPISEGDILALRGKGKAKVTGTGGESRKGRLFIYGEVLL